MVRGRPQRLRAERKRGILALLVLAQLRPDARQVRNGAVHILDYKPDAQTNKPIAQLAIYALALTRRVPGLKLFDIKCAWFNQHEYCEIFPRALFARDAKASAPLSPTASHSSDSQIS